MIRKRILNFSRASHVAPEIRGEFYVSDTDCMCSGRTYTDFIDRGHNALKHTHIQIMHSGLLSGPLDASAMRKHWDKYRPHTKKHGRRPHTCWLWHPSRCHRTRAYKSHSNYAVCSCVRACASECVHRSGNSGNTFDMTAHLNAPVIVSICPQ